MRIGIDLSMLVYQGSGVATYTFNAAKALLTYDHNNDYIFFYASFRRPPHFTYLKDLKALGAKLVEVSIPSRALRLIWNRFHLLPVEWLIGKVDVYFSSDYLRPPLLPGTKGITTVHDLIWHKFPRFHNGDIVASHARKMSKLIKYRDTIIVDSHSSRADLLAIYPEITPSRVHVVYPGISEMFSQAPAKYSKKNYLLYVGAIEPRKNIDRAIKLFADLIKIDKYAGFQFLIGGRAGWKNEHIYQLVKTLGLSQKVIFLGFVKDSDLPKLYGQAQACIYLSEYEGFGLPPLEAAACGTPTLLYNHSSLGELFPGTYPFAQKGTELTTLIKLIETGRSLPLSKYAQEFSWEQFAQDFVKILSSL